MRNLCAVLIASAVLTGTAFAEAPLAPGKPAGTHKAQSEDTTLYTVLGLGILAGAAVILSSGDSDGTLAPGVVPAATGTP